MRRWGENKDSVSSLAAKVGAGLAYSSETPADPSTEWLRTAKGSARQLSRQP